MVIADFREKKTHKEHHGDPRQGAPPSRPHPQDVRPPPQTDLRQMIIERREQAADGEKTQRDPDRRAREGKKERFVKTWGGGGGEWGISIGSCTTAARIASEKHPK